jgi:hypothetical protein|tara:strand:- start:90 stop:242 length:153 start_codon:yes stop_codon:yes gene_type:complete
MKVAKTKVPLDEKDGEMTYALYINILNFKDEKEWLDCFKSVKSILKKHKD